MKSNMIINVEFLAGTDIKQAVDEAKQKAGDLDVAYICFRFNGTNFSIGRHADTDDVLDEWKNHSGKIGITAA